MRRASLVFLIIALACIPATAAAGRLSADARAAAATVQFKLPPTNGFRASVETFGRQVTLTILRGHQFAIYRVRGRVSADGDVDARFGSLGRISITFEPDATRHDPCREAIEGAAGTFAGAIEFTAERHYVRLSARRVRGHAYIPSETIECREGPPAPNRPSFDEVEEKEDEETDTATLTAYGPGKRHAFRAVAVRGPGERSETYFFAWTDERRGSMRVSRVVSTLARARTFVFDPSSLATATVRPPKPFQGDGEFRRNPDGSTSWTGTVTAPILGAGRITVAASSFVVSMVREVPGD